MKIACLKDVQTGNFIFFNLCFTFSESADLFANGMV